MSALIVTAAVAVLPTVDGREQYLYEGAIFDSEGITEKGLEHARAQGLIDDAPEFVEDEEPLAVFSQADVDAAVKAATDAKDAELADARRVVEERATEVAKQIEELETARADAAKAEAPKAPANKTTAAKQS
ncbi:acyl-CoA reductase-like NAD-dependent aldehyde dehydrogenase [Microbacterium foliorum]|uniref:Acyl-CoA reductase-like NAD-dependent aldehyde dehydrogenase n=1 Tax=Microbacterium foliorum TaxID=104336 RepID=A0ABU1HPS2_9MICO|nr:hypothetical protein [Microbacterium foliorum]MDR6142042.1 acyl-CoA reductase-like NAD-dependent aldehyde dehydrogenase [Microbacterium foliorum]